MPPRRHFAKSQEFVYKKVGKGSREKFKLVAKDIPRNIASGSTQGTDTAPNVPPIVSAPSEAATDLPNYMDDDFDSRPKKSGKVGTFVLLMNLTYHAAIDTVRLYENLAE